MLDVRGAHQRAFWGKTSPDQLVKQYGSPLYVYNESVFRRCCQELKRIIEPPYSVDYSLKANANPVLLRIARSEGLQADAMSPGEIELLLRSGYRAEDILFVPNNVSPDEMRYAIEREILISVDSPSQLRMYGALNPGGKVAVRFNGGIGTGHHSNVITAGKNTKFGVPAGQADDVRAIAGQHQLRIIGITQHIGSLFLEPDAYVAAAAALFNLALQFGDLEFVDLGGGFGIPYRKLAGQPRLDLIELADRLKPVVYDFRRRAGRNIRIRTEPGRYVVAESGALLGTVWALKQNEDVQYIGTDIGFNVLARPLLYDSWHDMQLYRNGAVLWADADDAVYTVVGNICETGDILARNRQLPQPAEGDILMISDAGAYGYSMSSNYNGRLRPAEVLIGLDGSARLIRRRETLDDLFLTTDNL